MIEYHGEKISNAEADRRYDDSTMKEHHTFLFILNERTCVDAAFDGNESRFINHSCDPNCEAVIKRGHIWIEAVKDIPAGTELVYDYQYEDDPEYTEEDLRFYACRCGSPNCRGTIVKTEKKFRGDRTAGVARGIVDYAGLFPPAALDMSTAVRNYAAIGDDADRGCLGGSSCRSRGSTNCGRHGTRGGHGRARSRSSPALLAPDV